MKFTPEMLPEYQARALDLLNFATDNGSGRDEQDPIYKRITEGRDSGKVYSSCGDLCHWMLFCLGVRTAIINRAEYAGWKQGKNISRLAWNGPSHNPLPNTRYQPGDILTIWNKVNSTDAHVLVVRDHLDSVIHSSDYGQPGGEQRSRAFINGKLGDRKLMRVLELEDILRSASNLDSLVEPMTAEEWLSRKENNA